MMSNEDVLKYRSMKYVPYGGPHNLNWMMDDVQKPTILVFSSPFRIDPFPESREIDVLRLHDASSYLILFILKDDNYRDLFEVFCKFLIEATKNTAESDGPSKVKTIYIRWKNFFKDERKLEPYELQGLFGEMAFLKHYLLPKYGEDIAIGSWTIDNYGKRDFVLGETWYECKSILKGDDKITISSIEQLDRDDEGYLSIVSLEHSTVAKGGMSLYDLYNSILDSLEKEDNKLRFKELIASSKLVKPEQYRENPLFDYCGITHYIVNNKFPKIKREDLPSTNIINATYTLFVPGLSEFKIEPK